MKNNGGAIHTNIKQQKRTSDYTYNMTLREIFIKAKELKNFVQWNLCRFYKRLADNCREIQSGSIVKECHYL